MTPTQVLVKAITLLYRESQLDDKIENSSDLVRTVVQSLKLDERQPELVIYNSTVHKLKDIVMEMVNNPPESEYDKDTLLQDIRLATVEDEKLHRIIKENLEKELDQSSLKKTITVLRRTLSNYYKEVQIEDILSKAVYNWRHRQDGVRKSNNFINELVTTLESIELSSSSKDPAVVAELDIGDEKTMTEMFEEVKNVEQGEGILGSGWQALNTMTQGGFRRGEFVTIGALQHNYKTGFSLSIFKQIALYNKPKMVNPERKPLLVRISFEDEIPNNLKFLYMALKYEELQKYVDTNDVTPGEMASYIKERLSVNGFHIKMLRIDPTSWTYKDMFNYVIELESQGYEVQLLMVDYLGLLPTTGCISTGPTGTDLRDLFRRVRNFCSSKKITFITPHQLSTDAKGLIRNGIPPERFLKEIAGKGYYERSKQLDQEIDLELYIHIVKHNRKSYLAVQRGKHRVPTILDDDQMFFMLPFPRRMPIPDDVNGEDTSLRKLPQSDTVIGESSEELFNF